MDSKRAHDLLTWRRAFPEAPATLHSESALVSAVAVAEAFEGSDLAHELLALAGSVVPAAVATVTGVTMERVAAGAAAAVGPGEGRVVVLAASCEKDAVFQTDDEVELACWLVARPPSPLRGIQSSNGASAECDWPWAYPAEAAAAADGAWLMVTLVMLVTLRFSWTFRLSWKLTVFFIELVGGAEDELAPGWKGDAPAFVPDADEEPGVECIWSGMAAAASS